MILECPSCHARFLVPIGDLAKGGRNVRCTRCQHAWRATLLGVPDLSKSTGDFMPLPAALGKPQNTAAASFFKPDAPRAARESVPARDRTVTEIFSSIPPVSVPPLPQTIKISWHIHKWHEVLFFTFLVLIVLAWVTFDREPIVKVLPVSRRFYDGLGLRVSPAWDGLLFDNVKSEFKYDVGTMKLVIDGVIHNSTPVTQLIPDIKVRAIGPDGRVIQSWWVPAPAATIGTGSDVPFHTEANEPMEHTIDKVNLEFFVREDKKGEDKENAAK